MIFKKRNFSYFFFIQFLGAFNDNVFKNAIVLFITFNILSLDGYNSSELVSLCGAIFILPFFLFSGLAGELSDCYKKSAFIKIVKLLELCIMTLAFVGIYQQSLGFLLVVLFLMGAQSAFFGPVKYSIIPEITTDSELLKANSLIEQGTFIAILLGTIASVFFVDKSTISEFLGLFLVSISLVGFLLSLKLETKYKMKTKTKIKLNIFKVHMNMFQCVSKAKLHIETVLISWYWMLGAIILSILPLFVKEQLMGTPQSVTYFLAFFSVGVAVGSFIYEKILCDKSLFKSLLLTSFIISVCFFALGQTLNIYLAAFFFVSLSICFGIFILPLYTKLQQQSAPKDCSKIIAYNNILNALFMVGGSIFLMVLFSSQFALKSVLFSVGGIQFMFLIALFFAGRRVN